MGDYRQMEKTAILDRVDIEEPRISVYKLLEKFEMEKYYPVCCRRIYELHDERIKNNERSDWLYWDVSDPFYISLDAHGLFSCKDILMGYVPEEEYTDLYVWIRGEIRLIDNMNDLISGMREWSSEILKNSWKELNKLNPKNAEDGERIEALKRYVKLELQGRSVPNKIRVFLKRNCMKIYEKIIFRKTFGTLIKKVNN